MHMKILNVILVIILLIPVSLVVGYQEPALDEIPYPNELESAITPFNITSILHWKPWNVGIEVSSPFFPNDQPNNKDFTSNNDTLKLNKGIKIPFYSSLLPLLPVASTVTYQLSVLNFTGPSNLSIDFTIESPFQKNPGGFHGVESTKSLNTSINSSLSGLFDAQAFFLERPIIGNFYNGTRWNVYSYINLLSGVATIDNGAFIYTRFSVQPKTFEAHAFWNHSLTLKISIAGLEDRTFLNYMRTEHGVLGLTPEAFQSLSMPESLHSNTDATTRIYYFGPMHQPLPKQTTTSQILYFANATDLRPDDHLTMTIQIDASSPLKVGLRFLKGSVNIGGTNWAFQTLETPELQQQSTFTLTFNWNDISGINNTKLPHHGSCCPRTYPLNVSLIELYLESSQPAWSTWANISVSLAWQAHNPDFDDNKMYLAIEQENAPVLNLIYDIREGYLNYPPGLSWDGLHTFLSLFIISTVIITYRKQKFNRSK